MTDVESPSRVPRSRLAALRVGDLRELAASLGIGNASTLRKGPLVDAITESYDISDTDLREQGADTAPESAPEPQHDADTEAATTIHETTAESTDQSTAQPADVAAPEEPTAPQAPAVAEVEAPADAAPQPAEPATEPMPEHGAEPATEPTVTPAEDAVASAEGGAEQSQPAAEQPVAEVPAAAAGGADQSVADSTASDAVTAAEARVDEAEGGAEISDAVAEQSGTGSLSKPASQHVNAGITGIAEDLQALQRGETAAPQAEGQQDGTQEGASAEVDGERQAPRRGRGRGRGRGQAQDGAQPGTQNAPQQAQANAGQQSAGQQSGTQQNGGQQNGAQSNAAQQNGAQQRGEAQQPKAEPQAAQGQQGQQAQGQSDRQQQQQQQDGEGRGRGRYRDRKRRGQGTDFDEPEIHDDDVLIPIAGILDVLENYAFVRTSGYLPGGNDVYVSLGQVKKYHLRKGDAVVGAIRQIPDADQPSRQKYNALVKVDSINGLPVAESEGRVEFEKLTPLYPQERLRLETEPGKLSTRIIDLVSPIGKGQRGLIVSPPKAGKTLILQAIANAVTKNNPEAHLMVVLVDERPEEVTDMQRTVKGEVIASTFDRPAEDHTTVAELAIERAKRLVELGYDVVVLLDSITRLGRAYNQVVPVSGRTVGGGVDVAALFPPKRFFGAARNIENGGSLTIIATALVETGSATDEAIFEEFKGTGNMELRLDSALAGRRIFPAVDVAASGTRREEMLMGPDEVKVTWVLRRALAGLDTQAALDIVLAKMQETSTNVEFLVQMQKSLPGGAASGK